MPYEKRTHARNVAVRLVVNVGFGHFPCDSEKRPIPGTPAIHGNFETQ